MLNKKTVVLSKKTKNKNKKLHYTMRRAEQAKSKLKRETGYTGVAHLTRLHESKKLKNPCWKERRKEKCRDKHEWLMRRRKPLKGCLELFLSCKSALKYIAAAELVGNAPLQTALDLAHPVVKEGENFYIKKETRKKKRHLRRMFANCQEALGCSLVWLGGRSTCLNVIVPQSLSGVSCQCSVGRLLCVQTP